MQRLFILIALRPVRVVVVAVQLAVLVAAVELLLTEICQTKTEVLEVLLLILLLSLRTVLMEETLLVAVEQQKDWVDFRLTPPLRQRVHNRVVAVVAAMQKSTRHIRARLVAKDNLK